MELDSHVLAIDDIPSILRLTTPVQFWQTFDLVHCFIFYFTFGQVTLKWNFKVCLPTCDQNLMVINMEI